MGFGKRLPSASPRRGTNSFGSAGNNVNGPFGLFVDGNDQVYMAAYTPPVNYTVNVGVSGSTLDHDTSVSLTVNTDGQDPSQAGAFSLFTAIISGAGGPYSGTINWVDTSNGRVFASSAVTSNVVTFDATGFFSGGNPITGPIQAVYSGNSNNAGSSSNLVAWDRYGSTVSGVITLTSPASASSYTALANVMLTSAITGTPSYPIVSVEYLLNGTLAGSSATPPYSVSLPNLSTGSYSVTAYAIDTMGIYYSSGAASFTVVTPAANTPQVALVSPAPTAQVAQPSALMLVANASPSSGRTISSVSFYRDGTTLLGTATTAPYTFTVASTSVGTYNLTAVATDNTGATGESQLVSVQVVQGDATASETVTYLHSDLAGSPIAATDESGHLLWRESYGPFGERIENPQASQVNRQFFHDKATDSETGLSYFGARYYDPVIGRFLAPDPHGFDAGSIQSFGKYTYGRNNPYTYRDPDGRNPLLIVEEGELVFAVVEPLAIAAEGTGAGLRVIDLIETGLRFAKVIDSINTLNEGDEKKPKDVTKRPSRVRQGTEQANWDNADDGPNGGKLCPTCDKEVSAAPGSKGKDWDNDHDPQWQDRDLSGLDRKGVLDQYNKQTRLRCVHCNRADNQRSSGQAAKGAAGTENAN